MNTVAARLYDTDFYGWIQQQAATLRSGNLAGLDVENLIEEIESMGRSEKRELRSRLAVLFVHLLKWQYQPERRGASWVSTIKVQRFEIKAHIDDNPSLQPALSEIIDKAWQSALITAEHETGLRKSAFPTTCPWTFDQAMDDDFWPQT